MEINKNHAHVYLYTHREIHTIVILGKILRDKDVLMVASVQYGSRSGSVKFMSLSIIANYLTQFKVICFNWQTSQVQATNFIAFIQPIKLGC